jgi:two-component system chemotaxis sensor kinase CheA
MNDFLEQFVSESRELVSNAVSDLEALRQSPSDLALFESVFRGFHTLKGGAGIVEFDEMGRLMHFAEDMLANTRETGNTVSSALVVRLIDCLDLVASWLDKIEASDALPATAASEVGRLTGGFSGVSSARSTPASSSVGDDGAPHWLLDAFGGADRDRGATLAVRYEPKPDCFFRDQDPLQKIGNLPGLCSLNILPKATWPTLEEFDPFTCNLVIYGLTTARSADVESHFADIPDEIEIYKLTVSESSSTPISHETLVAILEAQLAVLSGSVDEGLPGRIGSAARSAANLLRVLGADQTARQVEEIADRAIDRRQPELLSHKLRAVMAELASRLITHAQSDRPAQPSANSVRVDIRRVDRLVRLTGQLTVSKNAIGHIAGSLEGNPDVRQIAEELKSQHTALSNLVEQLQHSVLALRVVPLSHVFQRFPRVLREIATKLGKSASLSTEGGDTEADRTIVEGLFEPLVHVLRNAIDHGVESAEERAKLGKPVLASVLLRGYREGANVIIEVIDDGRGIDTGALKRMALTRGLIAPDFAEAMSDQDAMEIIFMPGLSTAGSVTEVSGRGVGMDVVRGTLERMNGSVTVHSSVGVGTTVRFTLPFSIMMARVMTVEVDHQMFGLPFDAIVEMVQVPRQLIKPVGSAEALVFRGQTVPIINLARALGRSSPDLPSEAAKVVVVRVAGHLGGFEVDRFGGRLDLMLTPPSGLLANVPGVAGTTLLGDGRVLIVVAIEEVLK